MSPIRVLVVEDSLTVRRHLCAVIARDPELLVVGEAADGERAIELCEALRPDVITMDMMLPRMSGLDATAHIMAHRPTPILVVSASLNRGELFRTYEALASGAVDVLDKPNGDEPEGAWEARFHARIKLVSRVRVVTHLRGRQRGPGAGSSASEGDPRGLSAGRSVPGSTPPARTTHQPRVVVIGASTGGPGALLRILHDLPAPFPIPILIALHLAENFSVSFAEWLDGETDHQVRFAAGGRPLESAAKQVVLAPPGTHLALRRGEIRVEHTPPRHGCRPSVDVLFESAASAIGPATIGCLLTGMGRDGAAGLLAIRQAGGSTLAQDAATSIVYGMPKEAVELGAASRVLPIGEFASALTALVRPRARGV